MLLEAVSGSDYFDFGYTSPGWHGLFAEHLVGLNEFIETYGFDLDACPELAQQMDTASERQKIPEFQAAAWNPIGELVQDIMSSDMSPEQAQDKLIATMHTELARGGYHNEKAKRWQSAFIRAAEPGQAQNGQMPGSTLA